MNVKKPEDALPIIGSILLGAGLILDIGGWMWGLNTLSEVGSSAPTPPGHVQTGINVALIGVLIGTPVLVLGVLMLVASLIVHFTTKRKQPAVS